MSDELVEKLGFYLPYIIGGVIILIILIMMLRRNRYHKQGTAAREDVEDSYGTTTPYTTGRANDGAPVRSLYTSSKFFTLHHKITITDDNDEVVYRVASRAISLHDKTKIVDAQDNLVASVSRKVLTFHQIHYVTMADGTEFELSTELLHLLKDVIDIEGLGWQILGNIMQLNFKLVDERGKTLADIGSKLVSIHDKHSIDIYDASKETYVVAIVITLLHMLSDERATESAMNASSSSAAAASASASAN